MDEQRHHHKHEPIRIDLHIHMDAEQTLPVLADILRGINDLKIGQGQIMSKISEFAEKMVAHNEKVDTAITGLQEDLTSLKDQITQLQNSAGEISPEDQSLLDAIEAKAGTVADKLEALDGLTPPTPPTA